MGRGDPYPVPQVIKRKSSQFRVLRLITFWLVTDCIERLVLCSGESVTKVL